MKFLHVGDLHIGKQLGGYSLLKDQEFALEGILALARDRQVDAVVLAGDIYDKASPSAEAVGLFDRFLTSVSRAGIACLGIPGNHDSAERIAYASGILSEQRVYFPATYDGSVTSVELGGEDGKAVFWLLPFLKPAQVRPHFPEADIGTDYTAACTAALSACQIDPAKCNVLVAHQFVTASGSDTQRASDELNLGGVDNVDFHVFDAFDYVALGHVHRAQRVGRDQVRYAGSLLKYSATEVPFAKSVVLVDVRPKEEGCAVGDCVSFELLPVPVLRDVRKVQGPLEQLLSPEVVASANKDDYLFVELTDEVPQIDAMRKLQASYPHVVSLGYSFDKGEAGLVDVSVEESFDLDSLDPMELFSTFFEAQVGHGLSDEQQGIACQALQSAREAFAQGEEPWQEGGRK